MRWGIDLDGVMWRGSEAIPGSATAISRLQAAGHQVVFCTNHALSPAHKVDELRRHGVPDPEVVTAAQVAVEQCAPGERVALLTDPSVVELVTARGAEAIDLRFADATFRPDTADVVIVGAHEDWDRARIGLAADVARSGARFVATNDDPTFPVTGPQGPILLPGNGALLAAVEVAAGRRAIVCGKPSALMADALTRAYGPFDVIVGDRTDTDGGLAELCGAQFGFVLSGSMTRGDLDETAPPAWIAEDLADLVSQVLDGSRSS